MSYRQQDFSDDWSTEESTVPAIFRTPVLTTTPVETVDHWPESDTEILRMCGGEN